MRISCALLPWVVVTGLVVLLWRLFVRTNVCGVGHGSPLLVRLDNICVKRTRWVTGNEDFFGGEGSGPEIGEIENDDGESGDPAAIADVAPGACRVFFSSEEASPADGSRAQSSSVLYGCEFGFLFSGRVFLASVTGA